MPSTRPAPPGRQPGGPRSVLSTPTSILSDWRPQQTGLRGETEETVRVLVNAYPHSRPPNPLGVTADVQRKTVKSSSQAGSRTDAKLTNEGG